jgi:hypothetical protein
MVGVPIISCDSLTRMLLHDSNSVDNLLFEWICMLACYKDPKARIKVILPILFGYRKDGLISNLFSENIIENLPDTPPTETLKVAVEILSINKVDISVVDVSQLTVRSIVKQMLGFLSFTSWNSKKLIYECTLCLVDSLQKIEMQSENNAIAVNTNASISPEPSLSIMKTSSSSSANVLTKPLAELSIEDISNLMQNIQLGMYIEEFKANCIDGPSLESCEKVDDLKEVGVAKTLHAGKLLKLVEDWKVNGVPLSKLNSSS